MPAAVASAKKCSSCGEILPTTDFYRDSTTKDGFQYACKNCRKKAYGHRDTERYRDLTPDERKDMVLKRDFGIGLNDYHQLLEDQGGGCAICGTKEIKGKGSYHHIDHCHETGVIRGVLCHHCNTGLGAFSDNVHLFSKAIDYLIKHA
jgi:hypothetical protein